MKSAEVYGIIRNAVGPWCKANGFKRAKSMLGWSKPYRDRFLVFWFQCSRDGWDPFAGSKFVVEFQLDSISEPGGGGDRHRLSHFLDPEQLERVKGHQNAVIAKLRKPSPDYFILQMEERVRDWYLGQFTPLSEAPSNQSDVWLRYHDAEDVRRWAAFVQDLLPGIVKRIAPEMTLASL
jgi:hypothetical protein